MTMEIKTESSTWLLSINISFTTGFFLFLLILLTSLNKKELLIDIFSTSLLSEKKDMLKIKSKK